MSTTHQVWLALENQYIGNDENCALYLDVERRNFVQATSHLGLLHIIQGLNEKHSSIGMHLKCGRPFLAFLEAHPDLLLEKLTLANRSSTLVTAFTTS